ncbi:MAG: DUF3090 family protein [Thermomicrobiales bacterium]|nr:DUF3090 family protein [Thermomicrobiales bacterium]
MDAQPDRLDGSASRVMVEAIGEPGSRRFRLVALIDGETAVLWMEKQQLQALGLALGQVLESISESPGLIAAASSIGGFDFNTRRQFRVGRIELGFDEPNDRLVLVAHDLEAPDTNQIVCRLSRDQAREISVDADTIVNAGRPICPLCLDPMGPGPHVCPGMNGHFPIHADDSLLEDDE